MSRYLLDITLDIGQEEFARRLHVDPALVAKWKRGEAKPDFHVLIGSTDLLVEHGRLTPWLTSDLPFAKPASPQIG